MPGRGRYWKQGGLNDSIITSAEIVDGTISTDDIANAAISAVKSKIFTSTEQVGNGSAQNIAHGLGATPTKTIVSVHNFGASVAVDAVEGTHTSTNCVVTCTSGVKYKIWAMA
jgi:hypothetical protein